MDQPSSSEPVTLLQERDLGLHTLFLMSDGSMDLVANNEQTVSLADNGIHMSGDEAYRLFVALYEQFKRPSNSLSQR